jgi:type IV fimbrial biogenesis protein FimT
MQVFAALAARRQQRGLTLIEACMTLAIASVLVGTALPSFTQSNQKRVLHGRAGEIATDVYLARSEAVARQQGVRMSFYSVTGGSCMVIHTGSTADCGCNAAGAAQCTPGADLVKSVFYPATGGVAVTANVASMRFDQTNGTVSPAGTVRMIASNGTEVRHVVNILGRVRTCSPGSSAQGYKAC